MKKGILTFVFLGSILGFSSWTSAADNVSVPTVSHQDILDRLSAIEKKEDQINQQLEDIKAELDVVKIRASLKS